MSIKNQSQAKDKSREVKSNIVTLGYEKTCVIVKSTTSTGTVMTGDIVTWKNVVTNPNKNIAKANIVFSDTLDANTSYVEGSFKVNGSTATPTATSPAVTYNISSLPAEGSVTIEFDVLVS